MNIPIRETILAFNELSHSRAQPPVEEIDSLVEILKRLEGARQTFDAEIPDDDWLLIEKHLRGTILGGFLVYLVDSAKQRSGLKDQ